MLFKASALLAVLALVIGLVGCGGHSSRRVPPNASASGAIGLPSGIATTGANVHPGEQPPRMPAGTEENTQTGAQRFAVYWERALDWAYATVDPTLARSFVSSKCVTCTRFLAPFEHARQQREHFVGVRSSVARATAVMASGRNGSTNVEDVVVNVSAGQLVNADGAVIESLAATPSVDRIWLAWGPAGWSIVDWQN